LWIKDREACNMIQIKHKSTGKVIKEVDVTSLVNADLLYAGLPNADLQGAILQGAILQGADLLGADLRGADLRGADLQVANLQFANLRGAKLQGTKLQGANLRRANLESADLQCAFCPDLEGPDLEGPDIRWISGDGKRIKTIIDQYKIVIMLECGVMAIGCKQYSIDKWMNFSDEEIDKMGAGALQWWKVWKLRIQQLIAD
jgi:hypothetical protein